jgi:hypothetical protein
LVCKCALNWIHTAGFYKGEFVKDLDDWHIAFISLIKGQSKPLNIGYDFPASYTILDLWTYIIGLLKQLENKGKRVAFVFSLTFTKYYPLLVKLGNKDNSSDSNSGSDSKEEQDDRLKCGY